MLSEIKSIKRKAFILIKNINIFYKFKSFNMDR